MGFRDVIVKLDSQTAVYLIKNECNNRHRCFLLKMIGLLRQKSSGVTFGHIFREYNEIVYVLTKNGMNKLVFGLRLGYIKINCYY